jgi:hypothetical protein
MPIVAEIQKCLLGEWDAARRPHQGVNFAKWAHASQAVTTLNERAWILTRGIL